MMGSRGGYSVTFFIFLFCGCIISSCSSCNSNGLSAEQSEVERIAMIVEVQKMGNALIEKDYDLFIEYNIPIILESIGGKRKMLDYFELIEESFRETGTKIKEVNVTDVPILIRKNGEFQSIIKQELVLETNGKGDNISLQKMLGITSKGGKKWQFMDISAKTFEEVKLLIPDLDTRIGEQF